MGQKTHPTGFRVGIIQNWASQWYAKVRDYGTFVAEDAKIRKFVKKIFAYIYRWNNENIIYYGEIPKDPKLSV